VDLNRDGLRIDDRGRKKQLLAQHGVREYWLAVALQIVAMLQPPPAGEVGPESGVLILVIYMVVVAIAAPAVQMFD